MIGVFDVFEIELPVVRQYLGKAAGDDRRLVHHALDASCNLFAQIFLDRRYVVVEAAEDESGEQRDAQFARPVIGTTESLAHAALAGNPFLKGDRLEVAFQVVIPGVVDTGEIAGAASAVERDQRAAMSTAIFECIDFIVEITRHYDGHRADEAHPVIARFGDLGLETEVVPGAALVDRLLLGGMQLCGLVHPVRDAGQRVTRPCRQPGGGLGRLARHPDTDIHGMALPRQDGTTLCLVE